jgi:hypothetical protein
MEKYCYQWNTAQGLKMMSPMACMAGAEVKIPWLSLCCLYSENLAE